MKLDRVLLLVALVGVCGVLVTRADVTSPDPTTVVSRDPCAIDATACLEVEYTAETVVYPSPKIPLGLFVIGSFPNPSCPPTSPTSVAPPVFGYTEFCGGKSGPGYLDLPVVDPALYPDPHPFNPQTGYFCLADPTVFLEAYAVVFNGDFQGCAFTDGVLTEDGFYDISVVGGGITFKNPEYPGGPIFSCPNQPELCPDDSLQVAPEPNTGVLLITGLLLFLLASFVRARWGASSAPASPSVVR